jgi:HlyD family secretion protein
MQTRRWIFVGAVTVAFAGLGARAILKGQDGLQYRAAPVEHGDIKVAISSTGNPNAVVTVQVGTQVSGVVLELLADFNTKVTKGELIARIDPAPFQAKVDQALANLDAAQAAVANSQAVVQQALAGIQAASSSLAAAEANVVKARAVTDDAKVKVDRRVVMVGKGADSKEDLETAQTTYKSAVADHTALVAQQHAAEDSLKVAQAQLNVANSLVAANQSQVKQFTACAAIGTTRPRPYADHGAGERCRGVAECGCRADRCGEPGRSHPVPDRPGPDQDAGGYQRLGSRRGTCARGPACRLYGGCLSRRGIHG